MIVFAVTVNSTVVPLNKDPFYSPSSQLLAASDAIHSLPLSTCPSTRTIFHWHQSGHYGEGPLSYESDQDREVLVSILEISALKIEALFLHDLLGP